MNGKLNVKAINNFDHAPLLLSFDQPTPIHMGIFLTKFKSNLLLIIYRYFLMNSI